MARCSRIGGCVGTKGLIVIVIVHLIVLACVIFNQIYTGKDDPYNIAYSDPPQAMIQRINTASKQTNISIAIHLGAKNRNLMNTIVISYRKNLKKKLQDMISRQIGSRDMELVSLVRELMDPPSKHLVKPVSKIIETPQSMEVLNVLKGKRRGVFVEAGAMDGERSSNTLYLEQYQGWSGLLVEMDPYYYTQLRGKSRHCWSINACVSPYDYPVMMDYKESSDGKGELVDHKQHPEKADKKIVITQVPCFPLHTMLLALNYSDVHYFSLDVNGLELEVLKTMPFDEVDVSVLSVDYSHSHGGKKAYKDFMTDKGYTVYKDLHQHSPEVSIFASDFIFVKKR